MRGIFSSKQRELVAAAAKVDNLTKQLEDRRNGLSNARVTPEKLNRRRKIRAARDELDRLRKELTVSIHYTYFFIRNSLLETQTLQWLKI